MCETAKRSVKVGCVETAKRSVKFGCVATAKRSVKFETAKREIYEVWLC